MLLTKFEVVVLVPFLFYYNAKLFPNKITFFTTAKKIGANKLTKLHKCLVRNTYNDGIRNTLEPFSWKTFIHKKSKRKTFCNLQ